MVWPWTAMSRRDLVASIISIIVGIGVLTAMAVLPHFPQKSGDSFWADWECTSLPETEPVCVKRIPHKPAP